MRTAQDLKTGRFITTWEKEEEEQARKWMAEGMPRWKMANKLIEMREGKVNHQTAYNLLDKLGGE